MRVSRELTGDSPTQAADRGARFLAVGKSAGLRRVGVGDTSKVVHTDVLQVHRKHADGLGQLRWCRGGDSVEQVRTPTNESQSGVACHRLLSNWFGTQVGVCLQTHGFGNRLKRRADIRSRAAQ